MIDLKRIVTREVFADYLLYSADHDLAIWRDKADFIEHKAAADPLIRRQCFDLCGSRVSGSTRFEASSALMERIVRESCIAGDADELLADFIRDLEHELSGCTRLEVSEVK